MSKKAYFYYYLQITISTHKMPKTAVINTLDCNVFSGLKFGLRNAVQSFQRFISETLHDLEFSAPYLDNNLVATRNETRILKN